MMSFTSCSGSSPRLRGTAVSGSDGPEQSRFIPAPAGNSCPPSPQTQCSAVHPRACGEQPWKVHHTFNVIGSSPRLRGTVHHAKIASSDRRFIPAPAGNSELSPDLSSPSPVHPRACGEQESPSDREAPWRGSSPRLRGTDYRHGRQPLKPRFIPAPAGNRECRPSDRCSRSVHPRACGEQAFLGLDIAELIGSSPRLRGTDVPN